MGGMYLPVMNVPNIETLRSTLAEYGLQPASAVVKGSLTEFDMRVADLLKTGSVVEAQPDGSAILSFTAVGPDQEILEVAVYKGTLGECDRAMTRLLSVV